MQPGKYGETGNMNSYMIEKYLLDEFNYKLSFEKDDQILTFNSPKVFHQIEGYITRNESFSIATLSDQTWYAGIFYPVRNVSELKKISTINSKTFCKVISFPKIRFETNRELNIKNLDKYFSREGYICDSNFSLKNSVEKNSNLSSNSLVDSKEFCKEIGFTPGTEKFGDCIMKLMDKN